MRSGHRSFHIQWSSPATAQRCISNVSYIATFKISAYVLFFRIYRRVFLRPDILSQIYRTQARYLITLGRTTVLGLKGREEGVVCRITGIQLVALIADTHPRYNGTVYILIRHVVLAIVDVRDDSFRIEFRTPDHQSVISGSLTRDIVHGKPESLPVLQGIHDERIEFFFRRTTGIRCDYIVLVEHMRENPGK